MAYKRYLTNFKIVILKDDLSMTTKSKIVTLDIMIFKLKYTYK